jgi:c-di-GMP-binding flagellar brake protein YcgR
MSAEDQGGGPERRVQRRIHVGVPIVVRGTDASGHRFEEAAHSFDVSRTGLSFTTGREINVGADVEIVIPRSGALRGRDREFATLAHVVRVQNGEAEGERIVGVEFVGPRLNRVFVSEEA